MFTRSRALAPLACLGLTLAACGGDDDDRDAGGFNNPDATVTRDSGADTPDTGTRPDTGVTPDTGVPDAGFPDSGEMDSGVEPDGGDMDSGVEPDGGEMDGGVIVDPDQQIIAVRAVVGMVAPALPVQGAWVTFVRPAIGDDPAGFFVQASANGPALFVAVDPTTLTPMPAVGDAVDFEVSETEEVSAQHRVIAIGSFAVASSGNDVTTFVQDLSGIPDVVTALDDFESELISASGTLTGSYRFAGNAHQRIQLATAALPTEPDLSFRAPEALITALGLLPGCTVSVGPTPMWRFAANAQISAWSAADITVTACANAPRLVNAVAPNATTVELTFDRPITGASATPAQFTLQPAATIQSVSVNGAVVTLTTSALTDLTTYTVTVGAGVTDDVGNAIDTAANSLTFLSAGNAPTPDAAGQLVITEILNNADGNDTGKEWFELYNASSTVTYNLFGCEIAHDTAVDVVINNNFVVAPLSYVTIGTSTDGVGSHGFPVDLMVSANDLTLGNGSDEIIIRCGGVLIDEVAYDNGATFPDPNGASMNLDPAFTNATDNDVGANWCTGTTPYDGTNLGSPGTANPSCVVVTPDAGVVDSGPAVDAGPAPDAGQTPDAGQVNPNLPTVAGSVIVTEVLQNASGSDDNKEWFEVYNTSATDTYDLLGCVVTDNGSNTATIEASLSIAPMGFATVGLVVNGTGSQHPFTPDYIVDNTLAQNSLFLGNGSDALIITCGGTEIDRVEWDNGATFPDPNGASMNLDPGAFDGTANDMGSNWCVATSSMSDGDFGTPGASNTGCGGTGTPDAGVLDSGSMDSGVTPDAGVNMDAGVSMDAGSGGGSGLVINEVDYDQSGSDTTEFVEIYNAGSATEDLTNVAIVTVNGNGGSEYGRYALSGTLAPGEYLVLGNSAVVVPTGVTFVTLPSNGMQNGAPDGVALIDTSSNTLIDALSYEGSITAATITGFAGPVSLVEGTAATAADFGAGSMCRSPNGSDTNDADVDFITCSTESPGAANTP